MKGIFKQMWAQRSSNAWLLMELIVVFVVVWLVVDPLYVSQYQRYIPIGFDYENVYKIDVEILPNTALEYSQEDDTDENLMEDLRKMGNIIRTYPGIEAVAIHDDGYPFGGSYNGLSIRAEGDSLQVQTQQMSYLKGWDYWEVYGYTSVTDDRWETLAETEVPSSGVIITKDLDNKLFEKLSKGDPSYRKLMIYSHMPDISNSVAGVVNYVKRDSYSQPAPILFLAQDDIDPEIIRWNGAVIAIRVKDGTSEGKFIEEFKADMSPKLKMRNLRGGNIMSYNEIKSDNEKRSGTANTARTQKILTIFFLMIVFLGVISSFWLKTETRCGEIGLRMALGANKGKIIRRFMMEGWVMVLVSSVVGLLIQLNVVYFRGMTSSSYTKIPEAWPVNDPIAHFIIVTLIVFALLILTVTIGSLFPAYKAANINPVDALRGN